MIDKKIPIVLISGFLGSGKTTLIGKILSLFASRLKIAIIQNEFAASGIDGYILSEVSSDFTLREINTGSIFCSCLFSQFKDAVVELTQSRELDLVIVEATGVADPIGIAQLFEDTIIDQRCYLSRIVTVVDTSRFLKGVSKITSARHQVQVADLVILSKVDLSGEETIKQVESEIFTINPLSKITTAAEVDSTIEEMLLDKATPLVVLQEIRGELSRCSARAYTSKIFKTTRAVRRSNLEIFLNSLNEDTLRLKGFVVDPQGQSYIVQYQPGQCEVIPMSGAIVGNTELISIGYCQPNFNLLQANAHPFIYKFN